MSTPLVQDWLAPAPTPELLEQAQDLLEERRVVASRRAALDVVLVLDEEGSIRVVRAFRRGLTCSCPGGGPLNTWCPHKLGAAAVWAELLEALPPVELDEATNGHIDGQLELDLEAVLP